MRFDHLPILETDRLILRAAVIDDVDDIFEYASDPEMSKLLEWGPTLSIDETKQIVSSWLHNYQDNKIAPWVIINKIDNKVIGTIEVRINQDNPHEGELGFALSKSYWGQGLMLEAINKVVSCLIHEKFSKIIAFIRNDNIQSKRVCEKAGFNIDLLNAKQEIMKGNLVTLDRWAKNLY